MVEQEQEEKAAFVEQEVPAAEYAPAPIDDAGYVSAAPAIVPTFDAVAREYRR